MGAIMPFSSITKKRNTLDELRGLYALLVADHTTKVTSEEGNVLDT